MRLSRTFTFGERCKLQLVGQAFNLTNRANYGNDFNGNIASPSTFGHPAGFLTPAPPPFRVRSGASLAFVLLSKG